MRAPNLAATIQQFARGLLAHAIARAFTPPPDIPIWDWADKNVWLQSEDAAEPGPYRSAKTPWTRRLQELARRPEMWCWDYAQSRWVKVRVTEIDIQKSTQSGFTEAILNIIRWFAKFLPRNVIYLIDSLDQAKKIARRLLRSLLILDPKIFTGDPNDIKTSEFLLRGMEVIFGGSFSPGTTANKQAPIVVADEIEDHGQSPGDTSAHRNLKYRKKTSTAGLQFNLSKPKLENGPIHKLCKHGNMEEFHIACPHCGHLQWINYRAEEYDSTFSDKLEYIDAESGRVLGEVGKGKIPKKCQSGSDYVILPRPLPLGKTRKVKTGRLVYEHCKDLLGNWNKMQILGKEGGVYFECAKCKGKIEEWEKGRLAQEAAGRDPLHLGWLPTQIGTPGVVSQHMGDLLSQDESSSWGEIVLELIDAKSESKADLQGVINNRLGNVWKEELTAAKISDIIANVAGRTLYFLDVQTDTGTRREVFEGEEQAESARQILLAGDAEVSTIIPSYCKPYKRGQIPFVPTSLILGSDVGGNYARWVVTAVCQNMIDAAVIDWGDELDPEAIAEIILTQTWPCLADGKRRRLAQGFIDSHYRTTDVLRACWHVFKTARKHTMIPLAMIGGAAARGQRVWSFESIQGYRGNMFHDKSFKKLGYNFRESMNDVFVTCIQRKQRRIWFPVEMAKEDRDLTVEERQFRDELCNDKLVEDRNGRKVWADPPPGPNHFGAALKTAVTGLRFLTRKHHLSARPEGDESGKQELRNAED